MRDGWEKTLPPCENAEKLAAAVAGVHKTRRDEAIQEAWVAHLEGRCPWQAVWAFDRREGRRTVRERPSSDRMR